MAFDFIQLIVHKGRRDIVLCGRQGSIISFEMQISHSINLHIWKINVVEKLNCK